MFLSVLTNLLPSLERKDWRGPADTRCTEPKQPLPVTSEFPASVA